VTGGGLVAQLSGVSFRVRLLFSVTLSARPRLVNGIAVQAALSCSLTPKWDVHPTPFLASSFLSLGERVLVVSRSRVTR